VTAFLDGDRGGELILRELAQVGDVDYVAFAPESQSVEDLSRSTVMSALRDKVPYETFATSDDGTGTGVDAETTAAAIRAKPLGDASESDEADGTDEAGEATETDETDETDGTGGTRTATETTDTGEDDGTTAVAETDGAGTAAPDETVTTDATGTVTPDGPGGVDRSTDAADADDAAEGTGPDGTASGEDADVASETADDEGVDAESDASDDGDDGVVGTLRGVARDVIAEETGEVRLTDDSFREITSGEASEAFELLKAADEVPYALFVDGEVTQRLVDVAAQRGTEHVVGCSVGEFVKRPVSVRIRTVEQLLGPRPASE
jgi:hypothetical protein